MAYDPVKAHEYYMKHRKLKGRKKKKKAAKKKLSASQKEQRRIEIQEARDRINAEKTQALRDYSDKVTECVREIQRQMRAAIEQLPKITKGMSEEEKFRIKEQRVALRQQFQDQIKDFRNQCNDVKTQMRQMYRDKFNNEKNKIKSRY